MFNRWFLFLLSNLSRINMNYQSTRILTFDWIFLNNFFQMLNLFSFCFSFYLNFLCYFILFYSWTSMKIFSNLLFFNSETSCLKFDFLSIFIFMKLLMERLNNNFLFLLSFLRRGPTSWRWFMSSSKDVILNHSDSCWIECPLHLIDFFFFDLRLRLNWFYLI